MIINLIFTKENKFSSFSIRISLEEAQMLVEELANDLDAPKGSFTEIE